MAEGVDEGAEGAEDAAAAAADEAAADVEGAAPAGDDAEQPTEGAAEGIQPCGRLPPSSTLEKQRRRGIPCERRDESARADAWALRYVTGFALVRPSIRFFSVGQKNFLRQRRCCAILLRRFVVRAGQTLCGEMSELAEGARLEIVYAPKGYLGFESPSLRQTYPASLFQARFDMAPL